VVLDLERQQLLRYPVRQGLASGGEGSSITPLGGLAELITSMTTVGDTVVAMTDDGVAVFEVGDAESAAEAAAAPLDVGEAGVAVLAQPAPAGSPIIGVRTDGSVVRIDPEGNAGTSEATNSVVDHAAIGAGGPLAPIVHQGCVFTVGTEPPTFTRICNGVADQTAALTGADPTALRLRLVNGWVWINDLTNGTMWIAGTDTELERIDDWGNALGTDGDDPDEEESGDDEETNTEENPDIGEIRDQEIDEDGVNEPPVARDDIARTRVDQPVVVDVVANDEDPDGDALMVTEITGVPEGTRVSVTADQGALQVIPAPGATGIVRFGYTVSDGRGATASAGVSVEVSSNDAVNRPPVAETDIAEVRGGASASFNVLNNDYDPDGDTFVLSDVVAPSGRAIFDPSGEITFTPDPSSSAGTIEVEYSILDAFGATANGLVRVAIRLDTSNNEPNAVNDTAVTVVGKPVTFNVMVNDTDPDNDPLTIAGLPQLVSSNGNPDATQEISLSDDGEFFFLPSVAGDYVFLYAIIDGSERDAAYIRVRVEPEGPNRPPVAVRDDITIGRGGTRNVYVLENDVDPDGDVVGILSWTTGPGIEIEQVLGFAFRVTVLADAPEQSQFTYTISDGRNEPVTGNVVVAVSDANTPDQPPVARPDTVEVRPGQTTSTRVLVNDYDPEGGSLRVVNVSPVPGADLRIGPGGQEVFVSVNAGVGSSFSFGYDVADEGGNQSGSVVQVRLVPDGEANRPPVARPDVARTVAGRAVDIPVLVNDSDPDGDAIQLESIAAQPAFGVATTQPDGSVRYEPAPSQSGSDRLRYTIIDANGERAAGEVVIGVLPADGENRPPTATNDSYTVIAGSDVVVFEVLANDSDPDGDPLSITAIGSGSDAIRLEESRDVRYEPPRSLPGPSQQVSFTYGIADGRGGSDSALATIDVVETPTPLAPIAVDDLVGPVAVGGSATVDVLVNDSDPDGRVAELTVLGTDLAFPVPPSGVVTLTDLQQTTRLGYTITDPDGLTATARVTVIVVDNVAPTTEPLAVETTSNTTIEIDITPQVDDADGDVLYFTCCDSLRGGTTEVIDSSPGVLRVSFVPDTDVSGEGGFSYVVDDQNGHTVAGAVIVTVQPPANTPPTAIDLAAEAEAGVATPIALDALVVDPDLTSGDVLSYTFSAGGAPVTLAGSTLEVSPPIDATGQIYTVDYTVTDSTGAAASAKVTVTVTEPKRPPPTAVPDVARTTQGEPIFVTVLANDVDPVGQGLTLIAANVTDGSGTASVSVDQVVYQPNPGYFGETTFTYTIEDARRTETGRAVGTVSVTVIGRPGVPSTPQATADNATATVTWALPPTNGSPLTDVELQVNDGAPASVGLTSARTLSGLVNGQPYIFRVRAANEAGWGEWSEFSAPVIPDTTPGRPSSPTVAFGDGQLTLTWAAPANEGSAITGYEVEIGGGASAVVERGTATTYVWPGLQNGTNYQFRVTAINAAGRSDASPWSDPEHPLREPDNPGVPVPARGNRYIDLAWSPSNPNGDPVIEYQVEMRSNPGVWVPVGGSTSYRWSNLANGVAQEFRVRARNRDPDWSATSGYSTPVIPCGAPLQPAAPTAQRADGAAVVTYTHPGDEGCGITGVQVRVNGGGTQAAGGSPHTFTGLGNGGTYTFDVRAQNEVGWGPWSPASNPVVPAGPPIGPGSINATPSGVGGVDLSWPAANANGSALTQYQISVNGSVEGVGLATSMRRAGLADSTTYSFAVRACNDVACGAWSPARQATTNGPPNTQNAPNIDSPSGTTMEGSWGTPNGNGLGVDHFDADIDPGGTRSVNGNSTSWNATPGTGYRIRVRACNAAGCAAWSPWSQTMTILIAAPEVTASYHGNAQGELGCSSSRCTYVRVRATGLDRNRPYTVTCRWTGNPSPGFGQSTVTSDGNGTLVDDPACYYGFDGNFWVTVGAHRSNTLPPPPP